MAAGYKQVSCLIEGTVLVIETKEDNALLGEVKVTKPPFLKNNVWYIPVTTLRDKDGVPIDERDNFIQCTEYSSSGMYKMSECKIIIIKEQSYIITKQVFKFINRRGSVRINTSIPCEFKLRGASVWKKGTIIDVSLTGLRLRSSEIILKDDEVQFLNEERPNFNCTLHYDDNRINIQCKIQRVNKLPRDIFEFGCKVIDNNEYNRLCIAEQVKVVRLKREQSQARG